MVKVISQSYPFPLVKDLVSDQKMSTPSKIFFFTNSANLYAVFVGSKLSVVG